jgi:hypothetical protein
MLLDAFVLCLSMDCSSVVIAIGVKEGIIKQEFVHLSYAKQGQLLVGEVRVESWLSLSSGDQEHWQPPSCAFSESFFDNVLQRHSKVSFLSLHGFPRLPKHFLYRNKSPSFIIAISA